MSFLSRAFTTVLLLIGLLTPFLGVAAQTDSQKLEPVNLPSAQELNQFQGQTLPQVIGNVIKTAMGIMGTIALVVLVSAGVMWMTTGGNSSKEEQAKDMMLWGAMGVIVILSSYIIVQFVFEAFTP